MLTRAELIEPYCHDWRKRYYGQAIAVVFPKTTAQVQALVRICQEHRVAIVTQGGNTSTCGAATPLTDYPRPQLIINLTQMNQIIALDSANQSLIVEAGCTLQQVQEFASQHNLYFPLELASQGSCQIGANLATNAGGVHVLKYGMTRNLTLGLEVVLADGSCLDQLHALRKDNTYLDLKQLIIGSEGTLGIITRVCLRLFPQPASHLTMLLAVNELSQALSLLQHLQHAYSNNVSACEIIKSESWQLQQRYFPDHALELSGAWILLIEIETNQDFNQERLLTILEDTQVDPAQVLLASNERERAQFWHVREQIPLAEKQHGYAAKHDISLPLSQLADFIAQNMPRLLQLYPTGYFSIFGHLGDGNLHYNFGLVGSSQDEIRALETQVSPLIYQDVIARGGSIAAEHGIGQSKMVWLRKYSDPSAYKLMQQIKATLDPAGILNPGKILA